MVLINLVLICPVLIISGAPHSAEARVHASPTLVVFIDINGIIDMVFNHPVNVKKTM